MTPPKRRKKVSGIVWSGFVGEYKKPPVYIIAEPGGDGGFIDDFLIPFLGKKVCITIEELPNIR